MRSQEVLTLHVPSSNLTPTDQELQQLHSRYENRARQLARHVMGAAQDKTPVVTGRLRSGYRVSQNNGPYSIGVTVENIVSYFQYVENPVFRPRRYQPEQRVKNQGNMLSRSIAEYQGPIRELEQSYVQDVEDMIGLKEL
jgi:hypothetical protein